MPRLFSAMSACGYISAHFARFTPPLPRPLTLPLNLNLWLTQGKAYRSDSGGFLPRGWPRRAGAGADASPKDAGEALAEGGDDLRCSPGHRVALSSRSAIAVTGKRVVAQQQQCQRRTLNFTRPHLFVASLSVDPPTGRGGGGVVMSRRMPPPLPSFTGVLTPIVGGGVLEDAFNSSSCVC